jgi:hypothetical protein
LFAIDGIRLFQTLIGVIMSVSMRPALREKRKQAQSMVEYAIGIGCVLAVCLLVLGGLGLTSNDICGAVLRNIKDPQAQSADASSGGTMGIFKNGVSGTSNAPWQVK